MLGGLSEPGTHVADLVLAVFVDEPGSKEKEGRAMDNRKSRLPVSLALATPPSGSGREWRVCPSHECGWAPPLRVSRRGLRDKGASHGATPVPSRLVGQGI